jgi:peptide deformylase
MTRLKIVQAGEPVLRQPARPLTPKEVLGRRVQELIRHMRETMHDAPGVGLAAPQVGEPLQLAVIEDRSVSMRGLSEQALAERERRVVPFLVLVNPEIVLEEGPPHWFFEGCLSLEGFTAAVPRARTVRVRALDARAEPIAFTASGWFARIVQHEVDHLKGTLYVDRMDPRSFMTADNYTRHWKDEPVASIRAKLAG